MSKYLFLTHFFGISAKRLSPEEYGENVKLELEKNNFCGDDSLLIEVTLNKSNTWATLEWDYGSGYEQKCLSIHFIQGSIIGQPKSTNFIKEF